jgi:hypothetical protein
MAYGVAVRTQNAEEIARMRQIARQTLTWRDKEYFFERDLAAAAAGVQFLRTRLVELREETDGLSVAPLIEALSDGLGLGEG